METIMKGLRFMCGIPNLGLRHLRFECEPQGAWLKVMGQWE
jgi:hypothetical protein